MDEKDDKGEELQEEIDDINDTLDDLSDIEQLLDGPPKRRRKVAKQSKGKPKKKEKEDEPDEDNDVDEEDDDKKKKDDKSPEYCESCAKNAEKFIKDEFCRLADPENRGQCVVEAMKLVVKVREGKLTMHDFEAEVKVLGRKYIKDWKDDDNKKDIISDETVKKSLGDSSERE